MASHPKNPLFKACINNIINTCKLKLYKTSPIDITGPCMLSRVIQTEFPYEYITGSKFKFDGGGFYGFKLDSIYYNKDIILKAYPEYRYEQKIFQNNEHYDKLWKKRDVYI